MVILALFGLVSLTAAKTRDFDDSSNFYLKDDDLVIRTPQDLDDVEVVTIGKVDKKPD